MIILILIFDNNCKIFIYNCDTYFLGQKISFVRRIFSRDFTHEKEDLLKSKNGKRFSVKSNRKTSIDQGFRSSLFSIQKNEQIEETNKIFKELKEIKKIKEEENIKILEYNNTNTINNTITINNIVNTNNVNNKDNKSKNYILSILKSLSNNFSLFDDDILFSQMNIF